ATSPREAGLSLLLVAAALLVAGAAWLEPGLGASKTLGLVATPGAATAGAGGTARRRGSGRAGAVRRGSGRAASHRDRRRRGRCARRPGRLRRWCPGRARLELLPRPRPLDAVADAGLGRLRSRRGAGGTARPAAASVCAALLRARLRLQWADGRLGVVQLLSAHLGCLD